ncbi:MAG: exodeoxyribonuclease VII large subunit [Candidatus Kapaibacteriales bacterium]
MFGDEFEKKVFSVSEITYHIASILENQIGFVFVEGEISNFKFHTSGHRYFTLKDQNAQINCVFWRSKSLNFELYDGLSVIVGGWITVYPLRGQYQIDIEQIFPIGYGDLYLRFEALKKKLEEEGLFSSRFKKAIPTFPLKIGIATSPTGAAIQDMITTIRRRNPLCTIFFRETLVQGEDAKNDIVQALSELNELDLDVIIIGRGGGSLEDLWAFNEEIVARAIFNSQIPLISAVGHETDFTIADFVADIRAATPTAAAELVTPITKEMLYQQIMQFEKELQSLISQLIENSKKEVEKNVRYYSFKRIEDRVVNFRQMLIEFEERLQISLLRKLEVLKQEVEGIARTISILFPLAPLEKGFALLKQGSKIIDNSISLNKYKKVEIYRKNEVADVEIRNVKPRIL